MTTSGEIFERTSAHIETLTTRIGEKRLVQQVDAFVELMLKPKSKFPYKYVPKKANDAYQNVVARFGDGTGKRFLKLSIFKAILSQINSEKFQNLPALIKEQQIKSLNRIALDDNDERKWLEINNDLFHKEFGLASMRLYSGSARVIDPNGRIPRSTILHLIARGAKLELLYISKMGGFGPLFQLHAHKLQMKSFNREGHNLLYKCCNDLYDVYPGTLGMLGLSWFYDPALMEVSPELGYIRADPMSQGAINFCYKDDPSVTKNALAFSESRRKKYEEGHYKPKSYFLIWRKTDQLKWQTAV